MCRSKAHGGRRCRGSHQPATRHTTPPTTSTAAVSPGQQGDTDPGKARLPGLDTAEDGRRPTRRPDGQPETPADTRFFDLRESGYTGPIDQDGNPAPHGPGPAQRGDAALTAMQEDMRRWRAQPEPQPGPAEPMHPALARALGCDSPEGRARYARGRAYREAGYTGPLDSDNRIPDPDDPASHGQLSALAALSSTT